MLFELITAKVKLGDGVGNDSWRLGFLSSLQLVGVKNSPQSSLSRITADGAVQTFTYDQQKGRYISEQGTGAHDSIEVKADGTAIYSDGSFRTFLIL